MHPITQCQPPHARLTLCDYTPPLPPPPSAAPAHMQQQATHHRASAGSSAAGGSTAVRASQPGPHQNPPAAVSEAWVASQRTWVDLALNQPVELSGTDDEGGCPQTRDPCDLSPCTHRLAPVFSVCTPRCCPPCMCDPVTSPCFAAPRPPPPPLIPCAGAAWSSRGICHHSAANARAVHEVARAVKPDAVGYEEDSSDTTMRNRFIQAARSAPMTKLVPRLMDTPIDSYQQAHGQLSAEERTEWEEGLDTGGLGLGPSEPEHHLLGRPVLSDPISGVCTRVLLSAC
jgi:hypothetical protein